MFMPGLLYGVNLAPNCYAQWHLDESTGTDIADSSGNARDGTTTGSPTWEAGKLNNCLLFNGSTQYATFGNIAAFERTDSFSLECWFRCNVAATTGYVISKMNAAVVGYGLALIGSAVRMGIWGTDGPFSQGFTRITTPTYADGNWHHVIATYNGNSAVSGVVIWVDGAQPATTTAGTTPIPTSIVTTQALQICGRTRLEVLFNRNIDEVVIYNKVLTRQDVLFRYNGGFGTENLN